MLVMTFTEKDTDGVDKVVRLTDVTHFTTLGRILIAHRMTEYGPYHEMRYPTSNISARSVRATA
jgi:hypothetical protein